MQQCSQSYSLPPLKYVEPSELIGNTKVSQEYLGHYVNLLGHQQAAKQMLLELYSPRSIMETELRRKILAWYTRFDLTGGLMVSL